MLPLACGQERYLYSEDASTLFGIRHEPLHLSLFLEVAPSISDRRLLSALQAIGARHLVLRASFRLNEGISRPDHVLFLRRYARTNLFCRGVYVHRFSRELPRIQMAAHGAPPLRVLLESGSAELDQEVSRPFDYSMPPLVRTALFRCESGERLLAVTAHHLVCDYWSMMVLCRELEALCAAPTTAALPDPRLEAKAYRKFVTLQHHLGSLLALRPSIDFWLRQWEYADSSQVRREDFRTAPGRHAEPEAYTAAVRLRIDDGPDRGLRHLARSLRVTPYVCVLTALVRALHRITGKRWISVWVPFANRATPGLEDVLGWCVNSHLVTVDVGAQRAIHQTLGSVARLIREGISHQQCSVDYLWERLGRSLEHTQGRLVLNLKTHTPPRASSGLVERELPAHRWRGGRGVQLRFSLVDDGGAFTLHGVYSTRCFDRGDVATILREVSDCLNDLAGCR